MEIRIVYGANAGPFNAEVMAQALAAGHSISISHPFCSFEVDDWSQFMNIVWQACAECSRDARGSFMKVRMPVRVINNGKEYNTTVWYDDVGNCLHYASLY